VATQKVDLPDLETMTDSAPKTHTRLKVINLYGPPSVGKSAARSGIFWLMKAFHMSVEEVSEYAKYLVLSGRSWQLKEEQLYLFSKQHHKQLITQRNGYEFAVTDSPLQLCSFYAPLGYYETFPPMVDEVYGAFENINFFLTRDMSGDGQFEDRGRAHNLEQSLEVEVKMRQFLKDKGIDCIEIPVDIFTPWRVLSHTHPGLADWPVFPDKDKTV